MTLLPGIPSFDSNTSCLCFRTGIASLEQTLTSELGYRVLGRGVDVKLGNESTNREAIWLIQYAGCEWTNLFAVGERSLSGIVNAVDLTSSLSRSMRTDAVFIGIYSTAGGAACRTVKNGKESETLYTGGDETGFGFEHTGGDFRHTDYDEINDYIDRQKIVPALVPVGIYEMKMSKRPTSWEDVDPNAQEVSDATLLTISPD